MRALILAIMAIPLFAQPDYLALHIDISGDWRTTRQDNPSFANPEFDDSSWDRVSVGMGRALIPGPAPAYWIRRAVVFPPDLDPKRRLAITIGPVADPFDLYLNGAALHRGNAAGAKVPRPQTFEFPLPPDRLAVFAIRVGDSLRPVAWRLVDRGPWVITPAETAPRQEGEHALAIQKLSRVSDLAQSLIVLCMAVVIFLIWSRQRGETLLLWLGIYVFTVAMGRLNLYAQVGPHPLVLPDLSFRLLLGLLPAALFAHFVSVWTRAGWVRWPAWLIAAAGCLQLRQTDSIASYLPYWFIAALVLSALARYAWRERRQAALAACALLIVYTHTSSWGGIQKLALPRFAQYDTGGWISLNLVWHLFFTTVFAFAITVMLVQRLLRDREEKLQLAGELEAARTVQQMLLPSANVPGIEAVYWPAREVGGDFWQALPLADGGLLLVVGDVSGKGLRAAMVVSLVLGVVRTQRESSPETLLAHLNSAVLAAPPGGFITCCAARFARDGSVTVANAGHCPPYWDGVEVNLPPGLPLAVSPDTQWTSITLPPGQLTFVSDGVIEAANSRGELFGFDRTRAASSSSAREIAEAARAWGQNDDITVVTVQRASRAKAVPA